MKYRWKLLILFVVISFLPILIMRMVGVTVLRSLGRTFVEQAHDYVTRDVESRLKMLLDNYARVLWMGREKVETALELQAEESLRLLPTSQTPGHRLHAAYFRIHRLLGKNRILWQHTALENGLYLTYPDNFPMPKDFHPAQMEWYQKAKALGRLVWTLPHPDPVTGEMALTVSMPLKDRNQAWAGVTAIMLSADGFFRKASLSGPLPPSTRALLAAVIEDPEKKNDNRVAVIAANAAERGGGWLYPEKTEWLDSGDKIQWAAARRDFQQGRDNMRRMPYGGKDCLWFYAPIHPACYLVFILPYQEILKPARAAEAYVTNLIDDVLRASRIGLGILVCLLTILALMFSRTVTRPVRILEYAAQRLAHGDFNARVDFRSKDEFGRMGQVFNKVGPMLQEHYHMQRSLNLAMEVQQNLLPKMPPRIPGLDIAGISRYCDETGGDYYDFLEADDRNNGKIAAVVGDVTGHGIASALLMTTARALIRQRYSMPGTLGRIVTDVNRQLAADVGDSGRFMTLFLLELDRKRERLEWVKAGHDAGFLYDAVRDDFTMLDGRGLPLGVDGAAGYDASGCSIVPGQMIVIGTDGVWETRNPSGQMFGKKALMDVIRQHARNTADGIASAVIGAVEQFRAEHPREDDITLLVIKVETGPGPEKKQGGNGGEGHEVTAEK
ncbi:MAG: SpoIIE family protein phosphatase [Thermodesulfobacteriota bacterium]